MRYRDYGVFLLNYSNCCSYPAIGAQTAVDVVEQHTARMSYLMNAHQSLKEAPPQEKLAQKYGEMASHIEQFLTQPNCPPADACAPVYVSF